MIVHFLWKTEKTHGFDRLHFNTLTTQEQVDDYEGDCIFTYLISFLQ